MRHRGELTDQEWERLQPFLPAEQPERGRPNIDHRRIIDGILWRERTGAPWRDLPERYGQWNSAFQRYSRWSKRGVWQRILEALGGDVDLEHLLLDSTTVRAHQHAAGAKGGETTKRSAAPGAGGARRFTPR